MLNRLMSCLVALMPLVAARRCSRLLGRRLHHVREQRRRREPALAVAPERRRGNRAVTGRALSWLIPTQGGLP